MPGCCERALRSRQHHRFTSSCVAQRWQMLQHAQEVQRLRLAASGCGVCRVQWCCVLRSPVWIHASTGTLSNCLQTGRQAGKVHLWKQRRVTTHAVGQSCRSVPKWHPTDAV